MRITINEPVRDLLDQYRIYVGARQEGGWPLGAELELSAHAVLEPFIHLADPRCLPAKFGAFSYSYSGLNAACEIGRYCSIAEAVKVMGLAHPTDRISTSPSLYLPGTHATTAYLRLVGGDPAALPDYGRTSGHVRIGHDVWIGSDVLLARGVRIGDGAIVAAGSVVTRDVAPYAVVGGVPARTIRMRFDEETVGRLTALRWWRFGPEVVSRFDMTDPRAFADQLSAAEASGEITPRVLKLLKAQQVIAAAET